MKKAVKKCLVVSILFVMMEGSLLRFLLGKTELLSVFLPVAVSSAILFAAHRLKAGKRLLAHPSAVACFLFLLGMALFAAGMARTPVPSWGSVSMVMGSVLLAYSGRDKGQKGFWMAAAGFGASVLAAWWFGSILGMLCAFVSAVVVLSQAIADRWFDPEKRFPYGVMLTTLILTGAAAIFWLRIVDYEWLLDMIHPEYEIGYQSYRNELVRTIAAEAEWLRGGHVQIADGIAAVDLLLIWGDGYGLAWLLDQYGWLFTLAALIPILCVCICCALVCSFADRLKRYFCKAAAALICLQFALFILQNFGMEIVLLEAPLFSGSVTGNMITLLLLGLLLWGNQPSTDWMEACGQREQEEQSACHVLLDLLSLPQSENIITDLILEGEENAQIREKLLSSLTGHVSCMVMVLIGTPEQVAAELRHLHMFQKQMLVVKLTFGSQEAYDASTDTFAQPLAGALENKVDSVHAFKALNESLGDIMRAVLLLV